MSLRYNRVVHGDLVSAPGEPPGGWQPAERHASAEKKLGTVGVVRRSAGSAESTSANSAWWDADADDYHREHGDFLGVVDFRWCPEGLREADAKLLGPVHGARVLEVGCGSAPCARWLTEQGAHVTGLDLSSAMLRYASAAGGCSR